MRYDMREYAKQMLDIQKRKAINRRKLAAEVKLDINTLCKVLNCKEEFLLHYKTVSKIKEYIEANK